ncbi:MAG: dihydrofolate reductase [Clostridium sp.]
MISVIVAVASNGVIGGDNKLLWHVSEDLKRFKKLTSNHTIVMGRKTFESLPGILPNRHHVIITRDKNYSVDSDKVSIVHSIDELISKYKHCDEEVFIIGGGEIYNLILPVADKLYLTKILKNFEGDTTFPQINENEWKVTHSSEIFVNNKDDLKYQFVDYIKL